MLVTIAGVGVLTALAGADAGRFGRLHRQYGVALVFFVIGLHLLEIIPLPLAGPNRVGLKRKGYLAAFLLGLIFGVALGPCTFAYMAPMLAVTFKVAADRALYGVGLLAMYGVGHCGVIVLAGTFTEMVQHYLDWSEKSRGAVILKKICGVLVLLGGFYMIYTAR